MPRFSLMWQLLIKHIFNPETICLERQNFAKLSVMNYTCTMRRCLKVKKNTLVAFLLMWGIFIIFNFIFYFFEYFFVSRFSTPVCWEDAETRLPGYKRRSARAGPVRVTRSVDTWASASLSRTGLFSSLGAYQIISFKKINPDIQTSVWQVVRLLTRKVIKGNQNVSRACRHPLPWSFCLVEYSELITLCPE